MFADFVLEYTSARYDDRILILDDEGLEAATHYSAAFESLGFEVIRYRDDLTLRIEYGEKLDSANAHDLSDIGGKILLLATSSDYIPYDIQKQFRTYAVSLSKLFSKLNTAVLKEHEDVNLDLLSDAYKLDFEVHKTRAETEDFLRNKVYSAYNIGVYVRRQYQDLLQKATGMRNYRDWLALAKQKAKLDVLAVTGHIDIESSEINRAFRDWLLTNYGMLAVELSRETPVLVSRAMEYMCGHSEKFIIIVMDGMSEFDWQILSRSFAGIAYEESAAFAMIPTTTSVSRQCLLSGKMPSELLEPWKQGKEKTEFISCAISMGFTDSQIGYERGYDADFSSFVRCGAVIVNDVDDLVHAQHLGRRGMADDMKLLSDQGKLAAMTRRFLQKGYDVYITSDHGNTLCTGMGRLMGTGVEMQTKSRRMLVLQNFANKAALREKYGLIEYPKYYLPKQYDYLICDVGASFDAKGEEVMSHGGMTIDEAIVPFIKIKAGNMHG